MRERRLVLIFTFDTVRAGSSRDHIDQLERGTRTLQVQKSKRLYGGVEASSNIERLTTDLLVVGSGPSGVSACWPLVEAGRRVLLVDAGSSELRRPDADRPSLSELRQSCNNSWRYLLGPKLESLRTVDGVSPKLRTAAAPEFTQSYSSANNLVPDGFKLVGTNSTGGLSNVWGAGASAYNDEDLGDSPIKLHDLAESLCVVAARIGISGSADDDMSGEHGAHLPLQPPLPLSPLPESILGRYDARREKIKTRLGRARLAVLTRDIGNRKACTLDNACLWGCNKQSIYSSESELDALRRNSNLRYQSGLVITRMKRAERGYELYGHRAPLQTPVRIVANCVVLAAGPFASTRLVLDLLERFDETVPIQNAPAVAAAFLAPPWVGTALPEKAAGVAQLSFIVPITESSSRPTTAFGSLFAADALSAPDLINTLPLSRKGSTALVRVLMPALQLAFCYLPGEYSKNRVRLRRTVGGTSSELEISGGYASGAHGTMRKTIRQLSRDFAKLGMWYLPGSMKIYEPGAEVHYGASLPMGRETSADGEVRDAPGVFVVDASVLPRIAAKHHTVTTMANADRIARKIVSLDR